MKQASSAEGPTGLIEKITDASGRNPFMIGLLGLMAACAGFYALANISLDAVPDLSDVQVIVYTNWEGRNPSLVEDQITYPITSRFLGAPKVKAVRGLSMFGRSFVYVIFEDNTDIYWARSRVLEYLNGVRESLPPGVTPTLGPDATVSVGFMSMPWWTTRGRIIWRSCGAFRIGRSSTRLVRSKVWLRWPASAVS